MYRIIIVSLYLFSTVALASNITELENRNISDIAKQNGKEFEKSVVQDFWGNPQFMMQCAPPGSPIHKAFTIYIEILETGEIGQLAFTLNTDTTKCIESFVRQKQFKKPNVPFVAAIKLSFTK